MNKALPERTHARLKCYDYATPGVYFITICALDRKCVFSKIVTDENEQVANDYTEFGKIAERNLLALGQRFANLRVDKYVIMPNHIHVLFVLTDCASEAAGAVPGRNYKLLPALATNSPPDYSLNASRPRPTISDIVCVFKSLTTKECRKICPTAKLFQTSFYDHIVRTELDYADVVRYIENNPLAWQLDELYEKRGGV